MHGMHRHISALDRSVEENRRPDRLTREQEQYIATSLKMEESWRVVYEKVRFSDDDRVERPIVVY